MRIFFLSVLLLLPSISFSKEKTVILVVRPQSSSDSTHALYIDLITLALKKINKSDQYVIHYFEQMLSQGRTFIELTKIGGPSIFQSGTSIERERKLRPIRIPLLKGSLGYRISLIHKDNIKIFEAISTLEDLAQLTACQGLHWPDSDILERAGLPVTRNANYENMFLQIKNKRCDYFPRAIIEAYSEAEAHNDPDIIVYDKLIISYQFPMYFFVSPHQKQLKIDIENGLNLAIEDGSFDELLRKNKITKHLFPLSKWKDSKILTINNPFLPRRTPLHNPKLWVNIASTITEK